MPHYHAPLKDMQFLLEEVWNVNELIQEIPYYQNIDADIIVPVLEEAAKFCENILFPLNQSADVEGCHFENGEVYTPKGFKEAYQRFVEGGWMSLNADPKYGGQGLPKMLQVLLDEMLTSANISFSLYTALTQGAVHALHDHANDAIKQCYLPKLTSGKWSGTMCLTESHCGTDLGLLRTKAEPQPDGSYKISGTKIFITSGEHDLTENIIHAVLARLPNAPEGIKGISLFLVPKFMINEDNSLGERNPVYCGSIEHKMGIKGSATCVLNFDGATGYLIGEMHQGMKAMFAMMNLERLNIGLEGLGLSEVSYQNALSYAKERLQGRALSGIKFPDKYADPIIVHPDVRRMLLTMKAYNEAARALAIWIGKQVDFAKHHPDIKTRNLADNMVALITPVIKAFFTDYGFDACNLGVQILGGHGYVKEWGMEQFVRDARIAQIYEGTNGVQALDLVRRKLLMNNGDYIHQFINLVQDFINENQNTVSEFIVPLQTRLHDLSHVSEWILQHAKINPDIIGSSATDYLHLLALVCLAFMWAKMVVVAKPKAVNDSFYQSKIYTAQFYFHKLLPHVDSLKQSITAGSDSLMAISIDMF